MNPKSLLLILFSLFIFHFSLLAQEALPPLVNDGETFENRDDFSISSRSTVTSVAISKDGTKIVSGSYDNSIKIWDTATGKMLKRLEGHTNWVTSVAISEDGTKIVSGSDDNSIKIWDTATGKMLKRLEGHTEGVTSVAISEDGTKIVSGSSDNSIKIWDTATGKMLKSLEGHTSTVYSVAISEDGTKIVSGSSDHSIKIWDTTTGKMLKRLEGHTADVTSVAISKDGTKIVSGSRDNSIKIWDTTTGKMLKHLEGHTNSVTSVAISEDGTKIVSGSYDNSIKIWDRATGKMLKSLEGDTSSVNSVAISKDGTKIVSGSNDKSIKIWDRATGKMLKHLEGHTDSVTSVAISKDGTKIVSGSYDNSIKIWDRATGKMLKRLEGHTGTVRSVAISEDGTKIVSGSDDNSIKIWDRATGKMLKSLEGDTTGSVYSVAISKDGTKIVSGSLNGSIKIWDMATGKMLKHLEGHTDDVTSVAISKDGTKIVSGSRDNSIKIWDTATGKMLKRLEGHTNWVSSVAISKDGTKIVSGSSDNSIKIWDRATGKMLKSLEGHTGYVRSVAISEDGTKIVSGSNDNSIKIWDRATGKMLKRLEGHTEGVTSVAISKDGTKIVSGSLDGSVKEWTMDEQGWKKEFVGGRGGAWVVFDYEKKKFLRGDDGTLLMKREGNVATLFSPEDRAKEDTLLFDKIEMVNMVNDEEVNLNLNLLSQSSKSYFIKAHGQSDYAFVKENGLAKLEKGQKGVLRIPIGTLLPRVNPKPINHELNVTVTTANGSAFNLSVPVSIRYANIVVEKAEVLEDGKNLNVLIRNEGNEKLLKADVNLSKPFQADLQRLTNLEANGTRTLSFVIGDHNVTEPLTLNVSIADEKNAEAMPLYTWHISDVTIVLNALAWYIYALWALGVLVLLGAVFYYKRYKNPLVVKLSQTPSELMNLNVEELAEAKERLRKIDRFKNILSENSISGERYDHAIDFVTLENESRANYFAKRVFAPISKLDEQSYVMALNDDFPLNVKQFILFLTNKDNIDDMMSDIKNIPQYRTHIIVILSNSSEAQAKLYERKEGYEKFVVLHPQTLTKILLSVDGSKVLATSFSEQLALTQISPYQLGGGVSKSSMFFGRGEIVSHVLGRENGNYIIIGSRQIGKSSLLKAIEREYHKSNDKAYYISLNEGSLVKGIATALKVKAKTLDEVVSSISESDEKMIFLIDEADKFIANEKEQGYEVLNSFRKLSEEGRCNFILAGFWEIYVHAVLDYQSPLKNFGEIIELGALESKACREMIVTPMQQLGLKYADESVVNEIIERTGQRANLIAIICNNIIKNLGKEKRIISLEDAKNAIIEKNVYELFESWRELNNDERANRLDRIIVYATVEKGVFTLAELIERLKTYGLEVDIVNLEKSLDRLKVSYTMRRDDDGEYAFMLPLFREYILKGDYKVKLLGEIQSYLR